MGKKISTIVIAALIAALIHSVAAQAPPYDLILRNGRIVDGSGSPWYRSDVGIRGDTIARISRRSRIPPRASSMRAAR